MGGGCFEPIKSNTNNPTTISPNSNNKASKSNPYANNNPNEVFYDDDGVIDGDKKDLFEVSEKLQSEQLHKFIGVLLSQNDKYPGNFIRGSGILISADLVLTAAHNVWCRDAQNKNKNFCFYPGHRGHLKNPIECSVVYYPKEHETNQRPSFDYALLKLKKSYNEAQNFIPLAASIKTPYEANGKTLAIYGYPDEKYYQFDNYGEQAVHQWGFASSGKVADVEEEEGEIFHMMTTLPGQSGSPIIEIGPNRSLSIVGVHKGTKNLLING
jgi:V8-like Glu-specific endopeptidase